MRQNKRVEVGGCKVGVYLELQFRGKVEEGRHDGGMGLSLSLCALAQEPLSTSRHERKTWLRKW